MDDPLSPTPRIIFEAGPGSAAEIVALTAGRWRQTQSTSVRASPATRGSIGPSRPLGRGVSSNAAILVAELRRKLSLIDGLPGDRWGPVLHSLTGGVFSSHPFVSAAQQRRYDQDSSTSHLAGTSLDNLPPFGVIYDRPLIAIRDTPGTPLTERMGLERSPAAPRRQNVLICSIRSNC